MIALFPFATFQILIALAAHLIVILVMLLCSSSALSPITSELP